MIAADVEGILMVRQRQCFWSLLPLFQSLLYLPTAASSSLWRSKLIGGQQSHGLMIGSAAWRILTVAKVFWTVSWPLDGFIRRPSSPAECCKMAGNVVAAKLLVSGPDSLVSYSLWRFCFFLIQIWPAPCWISLYWRSFKSSAKRNLAKTSSVYSYASF